MPNTRLPTSDFSVLARSRTLSLTCRCRVDESLLSRYHQCRCRCCCCCMGICICTGIGKRAAFFPLFVDSHFFSIYPNVCCSLMYPCLFCMCVCVCVFVRCVNCNSLFARFGWIFPVLSFISFQSVTLLHFTCSKFVFYFL